MKRINAAQTAARIGGILMLALAVSGCSAGGPGNNSPIPPAQIPGRFSNADWGTVLASIVTPDGYVKWDTVQSDGGLRRTLLAYIGLINAVSPVNHPELFATSADRQAYWINAFNAMCVYAVVEHNYPATMLAGAPPGAIFSREKFTFGGQTMTLDQMVRMEIEPEADPRMFFALNFCASSSPPLRSQPYDGAVLDAQLVDQGQRYLSDPRAVVRDGDAVKLNDLFTAMHRSEFLAGFKKMLGTAPTGLIDALQPFVQSDSPIVGATRVENLGFDWDLNRPPR